MKKVSLFGLFFAAFALFSCFAVYGAQTNFSKAILNCENYSQDGSIAHEGEIFNILITLEKAKNGKCVYKEKIYQGKDYQMLTCNFDKNQLPFMADSMERFSDMFKKEIAKNKIFEAKMTTNGEIFQKYLADPKYCSITHSKK